MGSAVIGKVLFPPVRCFFHRSWDSLAGRGLVPPVLRFGAWRWACAGCVLRVCRFRFGGDGRVLDYDVPVSAGKILFVGVMDERGADRGRARERGCALVRGCADAAAMRGAAGVVRCASDKRSDVLTL